MKIAVNLTSLVHVHAWVHHGVLLKNLDGIEKIVSYNTSYNNYNIRAVKNFSFQIRLTIKISNRIKSKLNQKIKTNYYKFTYAIHNLKFLEWIIHEFAINDRFRRNKVKPPHTERLRRNQTLHTKAASQFSNSINTPHDVWSNHMKQSNDLNHKKN